MPHRLIPGRLLFLSALTAAALLVTAPARAQKLRLFQSRHYVIHTNLTRAEVIDLGRHMDAIYAEYTRRFAGLGGASTGASTMPLYLFRQREEYLDFMKRHGIDAANSGGMFVVTESIEGLATWTAGRSRSQTLTVLQHEGFHQFAWNHIGHELPIWMNEGLAQYFEDAILVGGSMTTGLSNARRIELVRDAIGAVRTIDFDRMLTMDSADWAQMLSRNAESSALLYAQSWSMAWFLIHGEAGRHQKPLSSYLRMVGTGSDSAAALRAAFGPGGPATLEQRWRRFARGHEPDPINATADRLEFLGSALGYFLDHDEPIPRSVDALKQRLQLQRFTLTRRFHGVESTLDALDESLYVFPKAGGGSGRFVLLESARADLPPRIAAIGQHPEPTLTWSRDDAGELVQEIVYR